jgi:hypothetical protein
MDSVRLSPETISTKASCFTFRSNLAHEIFPARWEQMDREGRVELDVSLILEGYLLWRVVDGKA